MTENTFKHKKVNFSKLISFGFEFDGEIYTYKKTLEGSGFILTVRVTKDGILSQTVVDPAIGEPYTLHLTAGAVGSFVGEVREQYEAALAAIADKCFESDIFKREQTKQIIDYVRQKYSGELEFLWPKMSQNAIWRRADNEKWYGALLTVSKRKLGIDSDEIAEIIDLRVKTGEVESLIDNVRYYPGWHMNKKSWYTVILDGSVPTEELFRRIDESYLLAKK